tara:strand:- start:355 stop:588 length:234 start_codon:yes stop_codon:yes gene_type:complete
MKTFQEHLNIVLDETLIAEAGDICSISLSSLSSSAMRATWKKKCSTSDSKKKKKTIFKTAAKKAGISPDKLYNEVEK